MESKDPHLNILIDIQKQLGSLGNETSRQSQMLIALNEKVAIQNGRVASLEKVTKTHQSIFDNWKGRIAILVVIGVVVGNLIIGWIKSKLEI